MRLRGLTNYSNNCEQAAILGTEIPNNDRPFGYVRFSELYNYLRRFEQRYVFKNKFTFNWHETL